MIDKDQVPVLKAVIKTSYAPVLRRSMANMLLLGIEHIRMEHYKGRTKEFMEFLVSWKGHKNCKYILQDMMASRDAMIVEIMKQYGIDKELDVFNLYMDELGIYFKQYLAELEEMIYGDRFEEIVHVTKVGEQ